MHVLDDVIGGAALERGDGNARLLGAGAEDDRRGVGDGTQGFEHLEPVAPGHVVIQADGIEAAGRGEPLALVAVMREGDLKAGPLQLALHQAGDTRIVIDIEDSIRWGRSQDRGRGHLHGLGRGQFP